MLAPRRRLEQVDGGARQGAPPGADHAAVEHDARAQHAAAGVETLDVLRIEHLVAVAIRDQILVERRQQESRRRAGLFDCIFAVPIGSAVDDAGGERRPDRLEAGARVGRSEARPPPEVVDDRGAAAAEVTPGQLGERLVALQARVRARRAVFEERIGELLAAPGCTADQRVELGALEQMGEPLTLRAGAVETFQPVHDTRRRPRGRRNVSSKGSPLRLRPPRNLTIMVVNLSGRALRLATVWPLRRRSAVPVACGGCRNWLERLYGNGGAKRNGMPRPRRSAVPVTCGGHRSGLKRL